MRKTIRRVTLSTSFLVLTLLGAGAAQAQQVPDSPAATPAAKDDSEQAGLAASSGEIVVTAQRVASTESKTPISMEVISGQKLIQNGSVDLQTLTQVDPSLNFDAGNGNGWITLRGVSGSGGIGPAVPVAFDGFYYNQNIIFNNSLYDVNRVEVLRGPQGTLFGRNASGGLINVITNDPTEKLGGYGTVTIGTYNQIDAEGALNIPISKGIALRVAFSSASHDGYRQVAGTPGGVADDQDARSARVKLAVHPFAGLEILGSFQITHVGGAGTADNIFNLPADENGFPTHERIALTHEDARIYNVAFPSMVNLNDKLYQLKITYDGLPFGISAAYLGGYDQLDYRHNTPTTGLDATVYGVPTTIELYSTQNPKTWNHEFRLVSAQDQPITWQAGVYYFRSTANTNGHFRDFATPDAPDFVSFPFYNVQRSIAGYGQASWKLGRNTLSAGLRDTFDYVSQTDLLSPDDGIFPAKQSTKYSKLTWHLGDDFQLNPHSLIYAKIDTGYRAGYFNLQTPCNCTGGPVLPSYIVPYSPEYVTAYEVGSKNRLLGGHLILNADAFYMDYKDEQLPESNQAGSFTVNAKRTKIYGAELGMDAIIDNIGQLDLNLTWLHARFASQLFTNAVNQTFDIGGNRLTQSPSLSLEAGFEHYFILSSGRVTARIQTKYQSGQYFDFYNVPDSYQKPFTRTDVHLTYESEGRHWSVDAFVQNLENSLVIVDEMESFSPPLTVPGTYNVGFQAPRTFGIRFSTKF